MPGATYAIDPYYNTQTIRSSTSTHHHNSRGHGLNMNGVIMNAKNPGGNGNPPSSTTANNSLPNPNVATTTGSPRMMVGPQVIGARPGGLPATYIPNVGKDEFVTWFRNSSGSIRLDTLSALTESCTPFEVRLLSSILEVLTKKESREIPEISKFINQIPLGSLEENRMALFTFLTGKDPPKLAPPRASNTPASSSGISSSLSLTSSILNNSQSQSHLNPNQAAKSATSHLLPLSTSGAQDTNSRPVPPVKPEHHRTIPLYEPPPQLRQQVLARTHPPVVANPPLPPPQPQFVNGTAETGSRSNGSLEDETDSSSTGSKDLRVLDYESSRAKLMTCMALLKPNHQRVASVYYSLITQVDRTVGNAEWMEEQSESVMEEVDLLYTVGIHQPAFTFEQRLMLMEILLRVRRQLQKKKAQAYAQAISSAQAYDPQYGQAQMYFHLHPHQPQPHLHQVSSLEHMGTPPPQQQPTIPGSTGHSGLPLPPPGNYYQSPAFSPYQTMGVSTHPQNPSYVNAAPIMSNVGHLSSGIRSTSPSNISPLNHAKDVTAAAPSAIKVELIPPPLYEMIPPLPSERRKQPQSQNVRSDRIFCFNCGLPGHLGHDCPTPSAQEVPRHYEDNNNRNKSN